MAIFSVLLFLLPAAAYVLWLRRHPGEEPPLNVIVPTLAGLALCVAALVWYGLSGAAERGTAYVPARLENGRIVRGHARPDAPPPSAEAPVVPGAAAPVR